jgi:hypothetical protein
MFADPPAVEALAHALEEHGDKKLAESYLNCGHEGLKSGARAWGSRHGFEITGYGGTRKFSWGAWR